MKKILKYLLCFILPILIFSFCLAINKIAPFGDYLITIYDSKVQYPGFFNSIKNMHFYLFNGGFGFNFFATATYYLMNPLNLLINLFDITKFNNFYYILIILKIGLCSCTMYFFLKKEYKKESVYHIIFSIIYSLIGYITSYYYNIFWLDGIIMLPLIMHGINNIISKNKPLFFIISLCLTIIFNFYIGFMCGIFSIIYFIFKLVEKNQLKNLKIIKQYIISSLLSIILSSFILLPAFFALLNGKVSTFNDHEFIKYFAFNPNIFYLPYSLTPGNLHSCQISYGFGQNFCTLFVIINCIFFFFNKNYSKKLKITSIIIILCYLLSYSFNFFDYAWQMFQRPVWWQHRYSFTFSCFLILLAFKNIINWDNSSLKNKSKLIIFIILCSSIILSYIIFKNSLNKTDIYRIIFIVFSILLIFNYIFIFNSKNKITKIITIIFIFLEIFLNCFICIKENNTNSTLLYDTKTKETIIKTLNNLKSKDTSFYRSELLNPLTANDGLMFNYNGINYFNSLRNQKIVDLMEYKFNLIVDSHSSVKIDKFDPYLISLFNIKYLIGPSTPYYFKEINKNTYVNEHNLSLGFMVDKNLINIKLKDNDYFKNITNIFNTMLNEKNILYYNLSNSNIKLHNITLKNNQYQKINANKEAKAIISFKASDNMFLISSYQHFNNYSKVFINNQEQMLNNTYLYIKKGDNVEIENILINNKENKTLTNFKYIKEKDLKMITSKLNQNPLNNIKVNQDHLLEATITNNSNNNLLFTTIAYEEGMKIKVNGKTIKPVILLGAFVGIELNDVYNHIVIDYIPKGLIAGIILSIFGLIILLIYLKKIKL